MIVGIYSRINEAFKSDIQCQFILLFYYLLLYGVIDNLKTKLMFRLLEDEFRYLYKVLWGVYSTLSISYHLKFLIFISSLFDGEFLPDINI